MAQEEFLLKWNDHHVSFFNIVEELCRTEQLCDVTLACGGQVGYICIGQSSYVTLHLPVAVR